MAQLINRRTAIAGSAAVLAGVTPAKASTAEPAWERATRLAKELSELLTDPEIRGTGLGEVILTIEPADLTGYPVFFGRRDLVISDLLHSKMREFDRRRGRAEAASARANAAWAVNDKAGMNRHERAHDNAVDKVAETIYDLGEIQATTLSGLRHKVRAYDYFVGTRDTIWLEEPDRLARSIMRDILKLG